MTFCPRGPCRSVIIVPVSGSEGGTLPWGEPPSGRVGFVVAALVNALIAAGAWCAATLRYGFGGYDAVSYHYEVWVEPVAAFLVLWAVVGIACLFVRGWRRFGAGVLGGATVVGLLDLVWTFVYFVSQGS